MATITFGGGPTVEQRRSFAALKDGTQVPGYRGYIPQIKYRIGKTYGDDTFELSKEFGLKRSSTVISYVPEAVGLKLPKATGNNKYTEKMVPGYSGYVPRMNFKFSNTYKRECDDCVDEFLTNHDNYTAKQTELQRQVSSYPRLTAISYDPLVRDNLNLFRDTHPPQPILLEDHRGPVEPPIPGYAGFVPRIGPTEIGLGQRYHTRTQSGLNAFAADQARDYSLFDKQPPPSSAAGTTFYDKNPFHAFVRKDVNRLYPNSGMIPKYTGYIPQRRFAFGHTYGDTTRSLDACAHDKAYYGEFLRTQPMPPPIVPC